MSEETSFHWYTGFLIFIPLLPIFLYRMIPPITALLGIIDKFTVPSVSWSTIIIYGVVLALLIYYSSAIEHVLTKQGSTSDIIPRSRNISYLLLVIYYGFLGFMFGLNNQFSTILNLVITLVVLILITQMVLMLISPIDVEETPIDDEARYTHDYIDQEISLDQN